MKTDKRDWLFWDVDDLAATLSDEERLMTGIARTAMQTVNVGGQARFFSIAITGGARAIEVAQKYGLGSTEAIKEELSKDIFLNEVVKPNIAEAKQRSDTFRAENPGIATICPTDIEGVVRTLEGAGKRWSEAGFHSMWLPIVKDHAGVLEVQDRHELSNGATTELIEMTMKEAGFRDRSPNVEIQDRTGRYIPLHERAEALARQVRYGLEHDLNTRFQATGLARLFHVHDLAQSGALSPADAGERFFSYDPAAMERLKAELRPVMEARLAGTMNLKGLDAGWQAAGARAAATPVGPTPAPAPARPRAAAGV